MTGTVTAGNRSFVAAGTLPRTVLSECVRTATAAPSLHNSQPWRFRVGDDHVDVYADRGRQLTVLDPTGRELLISVGAAVFTLRLAIRDAGCLPVLTLFPDPQRPDLVARVSVGRPAASTPGVASLALAVGRRHTNRYPFADTALPADAVERLVTAAHLEGAALAVASPVGRDAILGMSRAADRRLRERDGYDAELARWTKPGRGRQDGVPVTAIGPWDALEVLPVRDFALPRRDRDPLTAEFEPHPTIVVLATRGDGPEDWLRAGQALQRVLLTATGLGLATTPISQPVELPAVRALLTDTGTGAWAQMVLRVGYGRPVPATPRRPLKDVLLG
ncbi:Acg family FMN-binding oxidoreductase [Nucisporomicrobium flavum]|jgi:nitroreductase|uniref:Acg family FMN-binding oxidoreductase n=1 Tax=Nucisporomicrobium flavum TaxID=2785915 RepID=UPI0018F785C2|nr:nitroreductase family protein [Nucisporomicrobium flavum]